MGYEHIQVKIALELHLLNIHTLKARNNLRAMKKGDLAFFYHSSCKVPAIVGIMEIVEEHSPDRKFRLFNPLHFPIIQNLVNITKSQHMILQHPTTILLLTLITPNGQSYM